MQGLIKDCHLVAAERLFPGIRRFYERLSHKPATFLELVWKYEHWFERSHEEGSNDQVPTSPRQAS